MIAFKKFGISSTRPQRAFPNVVFVLAACGALSLPAGAQSGLPIWVPQNEAEAQGCAPPTLEQCSDPDWLFSSSDPCAVIQNQANSECVNVLWNDMDERAQNGDEVLAVVPKSFASAGVGHVIKSGFVVANQEREYVGDVFSLTSQEAQLDYVGSNTIGVDIYAFYEGNGNEIDSCLEYAYEAFLDVNEFQREIGARRADYRYIVDTAYGSVNDPASIGTRHLNNPSLRGRDGQFFGAIFTESNEKKNVFFNLVQSPLPPAAEVPIPGAPPLLSSIALRSQAAAALLQKIEDNKSLNGHIVQKTWAWNKEISDLLHQAPPSEGGPIMLDLGFANLGQVDDGDNALEQFGSFQAAGEPVRKRLDDELDALYELQQKMLKLVARWALLNATYFNTGWNVVDAGLEDDTPDLGNILIAPQINLGDPAPDLQNFAPPPAQVFPGGNVPLPALDIGIEDPETVQRRGVLDAMVEILLRADGEGCLQRGPTACDWSPKQFAQRALYDFGAQEDEALAWCRDFTKGSISNVLNLDIPFVDDPDYPAFACRIETGDSITASGLRQLVNDVDFCRQQQIAYREAKAIADAKDRVREVSELFDASTGGFKMPGMDKSRDELMGSKYFGLGYDYNFGFGMDVQSDICNIELNAGGALHVYAKLLTFQQDLIDAEASVDTETRTANIHAEVIGYELFTPIDASWGTQEDLHFNIVKTPKKSKRKDLVDVRIVIVVVPLSLKLGVAGEVGAKLGLTLDTEGFGGDACPTVTIGGLAEPFVGMSGYVAAAIDIFIAEAGIRGEINIITVSLPFRPGLTLSLIGDNNGDLLPDDLRLGISALLNLKLSTLSGRIQAYAKVGFCPFCASGEFTFVEWEGPQWNTTLFNQTYEIGLGDLNAAFNL